MFLPARLYDASDSEDQDDDDDDDDVLQVSTDRGSQPVTDQFVLKVIADKPQSSYSRGYTRTDYSDNDVQPVITAVQCPPASSVTTATLVLDADEEWLTGRDRVQLLRDVARLFQLPPSLFRLRSPPTDRPLMDVADALAAGPGDLGAARPHHPGLLVEWDVGCGNVRAGLMASLELLEKAAGDGRIRVAVAHPAVGWYVTNNRRRGRRDPKHSVWPPHPTATVLPTTAVRPTQRPELPTATVTVPVEPTATMVPSPSPTFSVPQPTDLSTTVFSPSPGINVTFLPTSQCASICFNCCLSVSTDVGLYQGYTVCGFLWRENLFV